MQTQVPVATTKRLFTKMLTFREGSLFSTPWNLGACSADENTEPWLVQLTNQKIVGSIPNQHVPGLWAHMKGNQSMFHIDFSLPLFPSL